MLNYYKEINGLLKGVHIVLVCACNILQSRLKQLC